MKKKHLVRKFLGKFMNIKISDALKIVCQEAATNHGFEYEKFKKAGVENLLHYGVTAWNMSYLDEATRNKAIKSLRNENNKGMTKEELELATNLIKDMIDLRIELFPDLYVNIKDFSVHEEKNDMKIRVEYLKHEEV